MLPNDQPGSNLLQQLRLLNIICFKTSNPFYWWCKSKYAA
eukprot:UN00349